MHLIQLCSLEGYDQVSFYIDDISPDEFNTFLNR